MEVARRALADDAFTRRGAIRDAACVSEMGLLTHPRCQRRASLHTQVVVDERNVERRLSGPTATPKSLRALRAHIRTMKGRPDHAPLFSSNRCTPMTYAAVYKVWGQLCAGAGLVDADGKPRYTLHQIRHTRGTELVEQGQRVEIVQRVLGHRDPRSTQGYAELHEQQVREALEQPR